jgi:RNA polymerase sigma-70 factor, ECF subfamily
MALLGCERILYNAGHFDGRVIMTGSERSFSKVTSISRATARNRFEALCAQFRPDVYRFAFWLARDRSIAEDVVQETFLRAWRAIDSLAEAGAVRPWLLTIARREHARLYERKRLDTVDIDEPGVLDDPALADPPGEDHSDVRAAILALEPDYREPLVLQVLMGYSTEEIATHLGIKPGAVLTRLFRARQKLRDVLGAQEGSR